jgi:opacity protein-like surface antigen
MVFEPSGARGRRSMIKPILLAACVAFLFYTHAFAADPMGSVIAVEGRPTANGTGGARALTAGSDVFEGDTITVGDGNAQMQLDDGTKVVVGPSSRLVLQSYLRRNQATAKTVGLKALRGTFRVITGNSPKSAYKISTSNATIGIRGTGFDFKVTNKTLLAVLEGEVRLRGRNGKVVDTAAGCGVAEAGGGSLVAKELDGQPKTDALQNELIYIVDQTPLANPFKLPVENCLPFLPANSGAAPAVPPGIILLPVVPGGVLLNNLLKNNKFLDPISPESTPIQCLPVDQEIYFTTCLNPCLPYCGYTPTPGISPFCNIPAFPQQCLP